VVLDADIPFPWKRSITKIRNDQRCGMQHVAGEAQPGSRQVDDESG
jgi:hypothetical protein